MSVQYTDYIIQHKENVSKAFEWLKNYLPEIFDDEQIKLDAEWECVKAHDLSKYEKEEYDAYDAYFYGGNRSYKVVNDFNHAWLHHIHNNPHHWQYWVLINDDPDKGEIILDMPDEYIIEMICDWWSFSWKQGKLDEIFNWYDEHKDHMKLSEYTRDQVQVILTLIKNKLTELNENGEN